MMNRWMAHLLTSSCLALYLTGSAAQYLTASEAQNEALRGPPLAYARLCMLVCHCMHLYASAVTDQQLIIDQSIANTKAACESRRDRRYQGTGKNCAQASDGVGGPICSRPQIGLCCDRTKSSNNCLTLFGDPPQDPFVGMDGSYNTTVTTCTDQNPNGLYAYCCEEMNLLNSPSLSRQSVSDLNQCSVGSASLKIQHTL